MAPFVFFGPVLAVHAAMKSFKESEIAAARKTFDAARSELNELLECRDLDPLQPRDFMLAEYTEKELNRKLELSTWPMSILVASSVSATYLLPIPLGVAANWVFNYVDRG